jgi:hypothetical protein
MEEIESFCPALVCPQKSGNEFSEKALELGIRAYLIL